MDSRLSLLDTFRDNNSQAITAADMRTLINSIYDEKISIEVIIDNLLSIDATKILSANQGRILKELIDSLSDTLSPQVTQNADDISTISSLVSPLSSGASGTFVSSDGKTITVTSGVITDIS